MTARILLYDLEITPILGWTYEMWDARVVKVERDPYIMCFAYKWLGDRNIRTVAQIDFDWYNDFPYDDSLVVGELWNLMDKADVVVAHNARKFDNRVATARFISNGFGPPSPYKTVDTLQAARRYFRFGSNSLNDLCEKLGIGEKSEVTHAKLWHKCLDGDVRAWNKMVRYCRNDVVLLDGLYNRLAPFIGNHPNLAVLDGKEDGCPRCGSTKLQYRGYTHTNITTYRRVQCMSCGAWSKERTPEAGSPKFTNITG